MAKIYANSLLITIEWENEMIYAKSNSGGRIHKVKSYRETKRPHSLYYYEVDTECNRQIIVGHFTEKLPNWRNRCRFCWPKTDEERELDKHE